MKRSLLERISETIVAVLLWLLMVGGLLVYLSSCKTVHKASSKSSLSIDSTSSTSSHVTLQVNKDSIGVSEHNQVDDHSVVIEFDSGYFRATGIDTSTGAILLDNIVTGTRLVNWPSLSDVLTPGNILSHVGGKVKKITFNNYQATQTKDSTHLIDSSKLKTGTTVKANKKVNEQKQQNATDRKPATIAWLSSALIWFGVIGLIGGVIWFVVCRAKKKAETVKAVLQNEIHS